MMVWKHTYHQHPQADQQQTICTEYLLHSFSVGHKNTKKSPNKQKSRIRKSQSLSTSKPVLQYFPENTSVLPKQYSSTSKEVLARATYIIKKDGEEVSLKPLPHRLSNLYLLFIISQLSSYSFLSHQDESLFPVSNQISIPN